MSLTWAPGTVTIAAKLHPLQTSGPGFRPEEIVGEVSGSWAIHRTVLYEPESVPRWTLTHVPSGFAVARGIWSVAAARVLAEAINVLTDWTAVTVDNFALLPKETRDAIRLAISTVGIE